MEMSKRKEVTERALIEVLKQLVGGNLTQEGFRVEELVEVYGTNDDGCKTSSTGFFRDENLAKAFVQNHVDASWHRTDNVLVLTDGKVVFRLEPECAPIFDDTVATQEVRQKALAKLTAEERRLLGL